MMRFVSAVVGMFLLSGSVALAHEPTPTAPAATTNAAPIGDAELVAVANAYRSSLEKLDLNAMRAIHTSDVTIFEQGYKNVGWKDYEENHIGPELKEMKAFRFTRFEPKVERLGDGGFVIIDMSYAMDGTDGAKHEGDGLVTLVLRRDAGALKIAHLHWSTHKRPQTK